MIDQKTQSWFLPRDPEKLVLSNQTRLLSVQCMFLSLSDVGDSGNEISKKISYENKNRN